MSKPRLVVIAGCNGAGKSSFSKELAPDSIIPFDYDKAFLNHYNSLRQIDIQDIMAHNLAFSDLEKGVKKAISKKKDFCYETNFNADPFHWPEIFKESGYEIELIFFCLEDITEAKRRVQIRVENGGHYVPESEIEKRYFEGYKSLDELFFKFDVVHLINSSFYNSKPRHILSISKRKVLSVSSFPDFIKKLLPTISGIITLHQGDELK